MEFMYGRGVTGTSVKSMRLMAKVLAADLVAMNEQWGIDDMTLPEWQITEDDNVEVRFRYESAGYKEHLR